MGVVKPRLMLHQAICAGGMGVESAAGPPVATAREIKRVSGVGENVVGKVMTPFKRVCWVTRGYHVQSDM